MEIKRCTTQFSYRIEQKPDGGYVAIPSDPSMETLEGASQQEVQAKIKNKINAFLGEEVLSEFKLGPLDMAVNRKIKFTASANAAFQLQTTLPRAATPVHSCRRPVISRRRAG
jgi:hypothetical protein